MTLVSIMMPAWKFPSFSKFVLWFSNSPYSSFSLDLCVIILTKQMRILNIMKWLQFVEISFISQKMWPSSLKDQVLDSIFGWYINLDFNLQNLESLIRENKQLQVQIQRTKETVQNLSVEYQKIFTHSHMIK